MSSIPGPLGAAAGGTTLDLNAPLEAAPLEARDARAAGSALGQFGLVAIVLSGLLLCLAAARTNTLLPETIKEVGFVYRSLAGAFGGLSFHLRSGEIIGAITLMFIGYVVVVREAERLAPRSVLWAIGLFTGAVVLAPPLLSTDLFSYQEYARMFFGLGVNPYTHASQALALDPVRGFIGAKWINTPSVYGPLFTLFSGLFQSTSTTADIALSAYAYKVTAALSLAGIVALVWRAARLRGVNQTRGAALIGLNPLVVLYGVGGGHNDLLMMLLATAGLWALLARRERSSGAFIVAAAAVKLTGGLFLPFALAATPGLGAGRRRLRVLIGAAVAGVVSLVVGFSVFGSGLLNMLTTLSTVQGEGGWQSVPGFLFAALHWYSASHIVSIVFGVIFLGICGRLLWRVWRAEMDWLDASGWAALFLLLSTSSVLPWYSTWLLVPVALGANRRLWKAALWFSAWVLASTIIAYLPHPPVILGFHT
ncbi:MAG TPA: glycosyltransferase 87 family protein [Solirubrobacteraceae bacterium]|nr:glycosyltransferase 87 family protein [Solirubrobacteraceae bacterium]